MHRNNATTSRLAVGKRPAEVHKPVRLTLFFLTLAFLIMSLLITLSVRAAAGEVRTWLQDFESGTDYWIDDATSPGYGIISQTGSMSGVPAPHDGLAFAKVEGLADTCRFYPAETCYYGPFTRFDGYRSAWTGPWTAEIAVFLDPAWPNGSGFDYSVATSNTSGNHRRDYIFHVSKDISTSQLLVGGSNNSNDRPQQNLESGNHYVVSAAGWYTLQHEFTNLNGVLAVNLSLLDSDGSRLWTETRSNAADIIPGVVGGNRYGWFVHVTVEGGLAVDSHALHHSYSEGGFDDAAVSKGVVRYRNFGNGVGGEIYLGSPGLTSRVEKDFYNSLDCDGNSVQGIWQPVNPVRLTYDPQTGILATRVSANHDFCLEYAIGDLGVLNYLKLAVVNRATGTSVAFNNGHVNGFSLGDLPAAGWQDFMVSGIDLSNGFVLEGDLVLEGIQPNSAETNKLEIELGVSDQFGPVVSALMLSPSTAGGSQDEVEVTATLDDTPAGISAEDQPQLSNKVATAEYTLSEGPLAGTETWLPLSALDGAFAEDGEDPVEEVAASIPVPDSTGAYQVCVRGTDNLGNRGEAVCTQLFVDVDSPAVSVQLPASVRPGEQFTLSASADDRASGGSVIGEMRFSLDQNSWEPLHPADGSFDSVFEEASATITGPAAVGGYQICAQAHDVLGNIGEDCAEFSVVDDNLAAPDELLGAARLRNLSALDQGRGGRELFLGVPDLGVGSNRTELDLVFATENAVTLEFQPLADRLMVTVNNVYGQTQLEYPQYASRLAAIRYNDNLQRAQSALGLLNYLQFQVYARDPNPDSQVDLIDVYVDGQELGDFLGVQGSGAVWHAQDMTLGAGFTLTATLKLAGITSTSQELSRVEVGFGFVDIYTPDLSAELNPQQTGLSGEMVSLEIFSSEELRGWSDIDTERVSLDNGASWTAVLGSADSVPDRLTFETTYEFPAPQAAGTYPIVVQSTDVRGNQAQVVVDLLVNDDLAPFVSLDLPESAQPQDVVSIAATADDSASGDGVIAGLAYQLDGGAWADLQPVDGDFDSNQEAAAAQVRMPNVDRTVQICVQAVDLAGNQSQPACGQVSVGAGPATSLLDYELTLPTWHTAEIQVQAVFSDAESGASSIESAEISLNGGLSWTPMQPEDSFGSPVEGANFSGELALPIDQYALCVRAVDAAGFTGPMECTLLTQAESDQVIFIPTIGHQFGALP